MTEKDIHTISQVVAEAMIKNQKPVPDMKAIVDWLFKALIAVLVWVGINQTATLERVEEDVSTVKMKQEYNEKDMVTFREFVKEPRYTQQQHSVEIQPLVNQINRNTESIDKLTKSVNNNGESIRDLKYIAEKNSDAVRDLVNIITNE